MTFKEYAKQIQATENFLDVLNFYSIHYKKENNYYKASCPLHDEKTPSFFVYQEGDKAKFKCQGCGKNGDIIDFIQYKEGINNKQDALKRVYEILGLKLDLKPSKLDKLKEYIYNNMQMEGYKIESIYIYTLEDHTPSFLKVKYRSLTDKSKKDMRTYKIIDTGEFYKLSTKEKSGEYIYTIYNYPKVKQAIGKQQYIYIVEGEKDAETLNKLGLTATTFYSKKWQEAYTKQLQDAKVVFIGDTGEAGEQFKKFVWKNLKDIVRTFRIVTLPGLEQLGDNKDVTDWIEAGHTKEELKEAIKDSWDWKVSTEWKDITKITKKDGTEEIKPLKTLDNFKLLLKKSKTNVFFNVISKEIEAKSKTFDAYDQNMLENEIYSYCNKINFRHTAQEIRANLRSIAKKNQVNPFKKYLDGLKDKWDGKSRLEEFYNLFETVEFFNEDLKKNILKTWLLQFLGSAYDKNFKGQGVLVLKGKQGMKKTTSMEYLIPVKEPWVFLSEQKFVDSRDGVQTITSNQLVELSEFARSAKEVDALKGFVTTPYDKYVLKYAPNPETFKRYTVYYATINDDEFLIDIDNRRFWILDLISMDFEGFKKFNFNQLWAELYHIYHIEGYKKYWMDDAELEVLEESNQGFKFKGELEGQIELCFDFRSKRKVWMTTTEVLEVLGKAYTPTKLTRTLKSMKIEQKTFNNKTMPRNKYNAMPFPKWWKGKVQGEYKNRVVNAQVIEMTPDDNEELIKENKAMKELLLKYKADNLEKQKQIEELKELLNFYEAKFSGEII